MKKERNRKGRENSLSEKEGLHGVWVGARTRWHDERMAVSCILSHSGPQKPPIPYVLYFTIVYAAKDAVF
jgi:hypothetical protein